MPAKDRYHDRVKQALVKDRWTITSEQIKLKVGERRLWIDQEASHNTRGTIILVEVKEMDAPSPVDDLANAVGQYLLYKTAMESKNILISLYLAASTTTFSGILSEQIGQLMMQRFKISLIVFDPGSKEIIQWIP